MSFHSWLQHLRFALAPRRSQRHHGRRATSHRPNLEVLEARTLPSFSAPMDYAVGANSHAVVTADFNNDGHLDLATANYDANADFGNVSVLLGNGDGTFGAARNYNNGSAPASIVAGDFNGDGKLDLVTGEEDNDFGRITVLLANGDGTFQEGGRQAAFGQNTTMALAVGDFDADGKLDVAAIGHSSNSFFNEVDVLLGRGDGTFADHSSYYSLSVDPAWSIATGDFNRDGKVDLAFPDVDAHAVGVLLGNGDGTFAAAAPSSATDFNHVSVVPADLNGDSKIDLVTADESRSANVLLGNGDGTFQNAQDYVGSGAFVGDFNGDGSLDLVVGASLLPGNGHDAGAFPSRSGPVAAGDFNGDGLSDLAETSDSSNTVSVLLNDGIWDGPPSPQPPSLRINDVSVTERNTGTVAATFTVALSAASSQPVTVAYATGNGTAGSDYQAASGTLTIPAGQTTGTITVLVNGDRLAEPNETFLVNLNSPTNATIADGQGLGTIVDDEPRIGISDVTRKEGKRNQTTFTFTVALSAAYDQPVTMSFRTVDGTATTSDSDYIAKTGTLTFNPGETTKTITIEVKGDSKLEANEYFYLDLFGNSGNSLFTKNRGIGTILNDD